MGNERHVSAETAPAAPAPQVSAPSPVAPTSPWPLPAAAMTPASFPAGPATPTSGPLDRLRRTDAARESEAVQGPVVRRIVPRGRMRFNRYAEEDDELTKITKTAYDSMVEDDDDAPVTEESGYVEFQLEKGEKATDWDIDPHVMGWEGRVLAANRSFDLPISCIESAEHIVWQAAEDDAQDWSEDLADDKTVNVHMGSGSTGKGGGKSVLAANVGTDDLTKKLPKHESLNFKIYPLKVGEGLVAINPKSPKTSLHAVAVVGVHRGTGQLIVVERNAGMTSGSTNTVDSNWLLNVYASAEAFRTTMGADYILGKLSAG